MKPYVIQLGIFACYSLLCLLWGMQKNPGGGGGFGMSAIIFEAMIVIIHLIITIILVATKQWSSHYLFALLGIAAILYLFIALQNI